MPASAAAMHLALVASSLLLVATFGLPDAGNTGDGAAAETPLLVVEDRSASLGMRALVESATSGIGGNGTPVSSLSSYILGSNHLSLRLPVDCGDSAGEARSAAYNLRAPFHILFVQVTFLASEGCQISHGDVGLTSSYVQLCRSLLKAGIQSQLCELKQHALLVANFSLGIGGNSLAFTVAHAARLHRRRRSHSNSNHAIGGDNGNSDSSCRRILLNIRRLERPQLTATKSAVGTAQLRVCQLIQECDFIHSDSEGCGLLPVTAGPSGDSGDQRRSPAWPQFLRLRSPLPACQFDQIATGARWLLPCTSCDAQESCAWRLARWWHPDCRVIHPTVPSLRRKLDMSRLVFLGDSTLRGLMFALYLTVNGSLNRWEKSHDTMIMHDSTGRIQMAFSYYPQFWRSPNQTQSFEESLTDILAKSQLANDGRQGEGNFNKTAIVIGGAQWLTSRMLDQTQELLRRLQLPSASVIVKDLSPGFHIKVPGVLFKPLSREATLGLSQRNAELQARAAHHGFSVLPTFRATAARFREFHPGKCACHFHSVRRRLRLRRRRRRRRLRRTADEGQQAAGEYAVDGDIHWTCTHLLTALLHSLL